jgi:glycogen phosphorylase
MSGVQSFQVFPRIPDSLTNVWALAMNYWWSWKRDAVELFRRIDPSKWEESGRNPILFLTKISQKRLEQLSKDDSFLAHQKRVWDEFQIRVANPLKKSGNLFQENETIAYFSMEFGIHESLPIFAGGLGILAGDHLKSASNLDFPLTGVGLLFRRGYFRQVLRPDGWQQENYPETDYYQLPITRAKDREGKDARVTVTGPDGDIHADIWKIQVGRIPLYLLDANIFENSPKIREITSSLYSGDGRIRLSQEVLLGVGGMRALELMGIYPKVCHMNEGHCSFIGLERLVQVVSTHHVDVKTALEIVPRTTVFTTHTPVAAGHDEFDANLVMPVLRPYAERLGVTVEEILSWGQNKGPNIREPLSMFILGMHLSQYRNGVSQLHGETARRMWRHVWPERSLDEIPISHITNGIHISSFISPEFAILFDRYLGPDWYMASRRQENIDRIDSIPDEEIWWAHELNRARLINVCRLKLVQQYKRQNAPNTVIEEAETILDNEILTIGFARRFATYKRADLLFKDPSRLEAILNKPKREVQFIFAGKAHPRDDEGKDLIRRLIHYSQMPNIRKRVVFLEDYDMNLARHLVQGTDAWLNNPRRPLEACGTSGMKAALNGSINISILDGWWNEGYSEKTGWAIGFGEDFTDLNYQDIVESQALYNVLENDVIPCFYSKKAGDISFLWTRKMKSSMKMIMERFCSLKMVSEYYTRFYETAARRHDELLANNAEEALFIAARARRYRNLWKQIRVEPPQRERSGSFQVDDAFRITTAVHLGELSPDEVDVEIYYGPIKQVEECLKGDTQLMAVEENFGNGAYRYGCTMTCQHSGRFGFTARVIPKGDNRIETTPGLITWA